MEPASARVCHLRSRYQSCFIPRGKPLTIHLSEAISKPLPCLLETHQISRRLCTIWYSKRRRGAPKRTPRDEVSATYPRHCDCPPFLREPTAGESRSDSGD